MRRWEERLATVCYDSNMGNDDDLCIYLELERAIEFHESAIIEFALGR